MERAILLLLKGAKTNRAISVRLLLAGFIIILVVAGFVFWCGTDLMLTWWVNCLISAACGVVVSAVVLLNNKSAAVEKKAREELKPF